MTDDRMVELFLEAKKDDINADDIIRLAEDLKRAKANRVIDSQLIFIIKLIEKVMQDVEEVKTMLKEKEHRQETK